MPENATSPIRVARSETRLSLTLANPQTSNALSPSMVEALIAALEDAQGVRSCVITGEGRNFCAGFDLSGMESLSDGDLLHRFLRIETLLQMLHHAPFPVMALCQGHVIGAGADLVAACWQRIAAPDATFKMPGWNFELALGTRRLAARIGSDAARDMLIDTRRVDAAEAANMGLVSAVIEATEWHSHITSFEARSTALPAFATSSMLDLTIADTRALDMAAIIATAGRPGLKARIEAYGSVVAAQRKQRK